MSRSVFLFLCVLKLLKVFLIKVISIYLFFFIDLAVCLCVHLCVCICIYRGFEVAAGPGGREDLQVKTVASKNQKGLG